MMLTVVFAQESDGRWIAEIPELPGVMVYGQAQQEAMAKVQALALQTLADMLEHGEIVPAATIQFATADAA